MIGLNVADRPSNLPGWVNFDRYGGPPDVRADLRHLPFRAEAFDTVLFSHVLEHIAWPEVVPALVDALRVLRPGGIIWIVTPDVALPPPTLLYGGPGLGWAHLWPTSRETWRVTLDPTAWDWTFVDAVPAGLPSTFSWPGPEVVLRVARPDVPPHVGGAGGEVLGFVGDGPIREYRTSLNRSNS